jgi:hypothetical protein
MKRMQKVVKISFPSPQRREENKGSLALFGLYQKGQPKNFLSFTIATRDKKVNSG